MSESCSCPEERWSLYIEGRDPVLDVIVQRRFGRDHEKPCARPEILTCAMWKCQVRNHCRYIKVITP